MKKLFFFIILFPIFSYSLETELVQKTLEANQYFISGEFEKARSLFQEFLQEIEKINITEEYDKRLIEDVKASLEDIDFLFKIRPALPNFKKASSNELSKEYGSAVDFYVLARKSLIESSTQKIPYFNQVASGNFEKFLIERKKEFVDKFSYSFIKQLQEDKKRKKTLTFLPFKKDPKMTMNLELIVVQSLTQVIEINRSFSISGKKLAGDLSAQLIEAKKQNIDFLVKGEYKKGPRNSVVLNFAVIESNAGKTLIEASVKTALDTEFFDAIEKISSDLQKYLANYSSLEEFATIKYIKEKGAKLVKEEEKQEIKDILEYAENKIYETGILFIKSLEEKNDLKAYHQAALQIITLNQENFKQKIPYEEELKKQKNVIRNLFFTATKLGKIEQDLKESKAEKDIEDYLDYYQDIKKIFQKVIYPEYPALKAIAEEIEKDVDNDKIATENESKSWEKKARFTHSASLYAGSGAIFSAGYALGYKNFELMLAAGVLFYKDDGEDRKAAPVSLRLFFAPFKFELFEPYGFAGGAYYNGIKNYTAKTMILAGAGVKVMKYFFAEACWAVTKDGNAPMLGLGVRFQF